MSCPRFAPALRACLVACAAAVFPWHQGPIAAEPSIVRAPPGTLEHFVAGRLLVVKPEDAAFIDKVAARVRRGDLPESMVRGTCEWAAERGLRRGITYPFPYFRTALTAKARRLGVTL
jgi:hypothetical protein